MLFATQCSGISSCSGCGDSVVVVVYVVCYTV